MILSYFLARNILFSNLNIPAALRMDIHEQPDNRGDFERHAYRANIMAVRFDNFGLARPNHDNRTSGCADSKRFKVLIQKKNLAVQHFMPPGILNVEKIQYGSKLLILICNNFLVQSQVLTCGI